MTAHEHVHHAHDDRAFSIGISLNILFMLVEVFYGWQADSLALLSDAGHNLSDVLGLLMAWGGLYLARLRPTPKHTYGWGRATIMAALFNALILLIAVGGIAWEAIARFNHPVPIQGSTVMLVAAMGVVINGVTAWLFMSGNKGDLNMRGAFLHMAADALVSLGVVVSGALFIWTGWTWLDSVMSLLIALVILFSTWGLLRQSLSLSLDGVPKAIALDQVEAYLSALAGVSAIHDLHIWAISTTKIALTVHLVMPDGGANDDFLQLVAKKLHDEFAIEHATIQIEADRQFCTIHA
ncbi:MAG: cation diffusion facilitator family transporter [Gallionella sp.]|nr:cation diffusion facilitator family transporter [Gallionella sp.]